MECTDSKLSIKELEEQLTWKKLIENRITLEQILNHSMWLMDIQFNTK